MAYAETTTVPVDRTRAEIEKILLRANASKIASSYEDGLAIIGFQMRQRFVRFNLLLPARDDERFSFTKHGKYRADKDRFKSWEQACRSRWRALYLCIKAKLEAIEAGITTFDQEFLAHIVIPGDSATFGEVLIPKLGTNKPGRLSLEFK